MSKDATRALLDISTFGKLPKTWIITALSLKKYNNWFKSIASLTGAG